MNFVTHLSVQKNTSRIIPVRPWVKPENVNEPVLTRIPMISHRKQYQQLNLTNLTQAIWVCVSIFPSLNFYTCFRYFFFNLCFVRFFTFKASICEFIRQKLSSLGQVMPTSRWLRLCLVQYLDPPWDDDPFYGFFSFQRQQGPNKGDFLTFFEAIS